MRELDNLWLEGICRRVYDLRCHTIAAMTAPISHNGMVTRGLEA